MPDVSLHTATEPLASDARVVIRYSIEVEGLAVYQESHDVRKLAVELHADRAAFIELWFRRVECVAQCLESDSFSARLTGCLARGVAEVLGPK